MTSFSQQFKLQGPLEYLAEIQTNWNQRRKGIKVMQRTSEMTEGDKKGGWPDDSMKWAD